MAAEETPKGIAALILGPKGPGVEGGEEPSTDEDEGADDTALAMAADELMTALDSKSREGVIDALRSLVTMVRNGG